MVKLGYTPPPVSGCAGVGTDCPDQLEDFAAGFRIGDPIIMPQQILCLFRGKTVVLERFPCLCNTDSKRCLAGHPFEEVADRCLKYLRKFKQAAGADAVGTALVFLDLLECQAKKFAKFLLGHAHDPTACAQTHANVDIYWVWLVCHIYATFDWIRNEEQRSHPKGRNVAIRERFAYLPA